MNVPNYYKHNTYQNDKKEINKYNKIKIIRRCENKIKKIYKNQLC